MRNRSTKHLGLFFLAVAISGWMGALMSADGWLALSAPIQGATLLANIVVGAVILFVISLAL